MIDPTIDIGVAQRARPGERESGDRCVVKTSAKRTLIGVIDGVGHGPEAALAAEAAAEILETFAGQSVSSLLRRCHERLRTTRGAAITLIVLDVADNAAEWVGAGNVAIALLQKDSAGRKHCRDLLVRGGIVGSSLPTSEAFRLALRGGELVVLATDGVRRAFIEGLAPAQRAQRLAEHLLTHYGIAEDDALVVVARLAEREQ